MPNLTNLTVIVLNYNSANITIRCVDQLLKLHAGFHIVVVDNNSPDTSFLELKEYYQSTEIDILNAGENRGYSAGNNLGIKYAISRYCSNYIAIANPDVIIPHTEVFTELMRTMDGDEKCAVVGASVINPGNIYVPAFSAWKIQSKKDFILSRSLFGNNPFSGIMKWKLSSEKVAEVECIAGCFFIASVDALKKVGFLDEDIFMYNEEILLGYKLKTIGYKELLRLDQFYYHNHEKKVSPKVSNCISSRKRRFASDIILYKKIYSGKIGLALMYILEGINRIILFPWFALKPMITRETHK